MGAQAGAGKTWRHRYKIINNFEEMLQENGTRIIKFFLQISLDEQRRRLQERIQDPNKHWKLSPLDLEERKLWDDDMHVYEDAIGETSYGAGAVVHHPVQSQVVSESCGGAHHRPYAGGDGSAMAEAAD